METPRPHTYGLMAGLVVAASLVIAAIIVANTWTRVAASQVVTAVGSARKNVRSDVAVWRVGCANDGDSLLDAYDRLSVDIGKLEAFLRANGIKDYTVQPFRVREITAGLDTAQDTVPVRIGYRVHQTIEVRTDEVSLIPKLALQVVELLDQGLVCTTESIQFLYTKSSEARADMIADAVKDARARAEQLAVQGGRRVDELRSASTSAVAITPLHFAGAISDESNDTTSIDKTIALTVNATFDLR